MFTKLTDTTKAPVYVPGDRITFRIEIEHAQNFRTVVADFRLMLKLRFFPLVKCGFRRRHRRLTKSSSRLAKRSRRQNWNGILQSVVLRQRKHSLWLNAHGSECKLTFPTGR